MKNQDLIDLCKRYEPLDFPPKEILRDWKQEEEPKPELITAQNRTARCTFTLAIPK